MPPKKHPKVLVIEAENPKQNITLELANLEDNQKIVKASLAEAREKLELLKKTLRKI